MIQFKRRLEFNEPFSQSSPKRQILLSVLLFCAILTVGTAGYVSIEGYSLLEGFYMTVITVTTVGFGEIQPLSTTGRMFTAGLILLGFGLLAFIANLIVQALFDRVYSNKIGLKKMQKKIAHLKNHFIICGYGRVGAAAADKFKEAGVKFVVIENNPELREEMETKRYLFIEGDATDEEILLQAQIKKAAGLLAILPSDPLNLFITLSARELNPTLHIIARAENKTSETKILRAGADSVISPFTTLGKQIASNMLAAVGNLKPAQKESYRTVPQWIEVLEGSEMVGKTLESVSAEMHRKIFGLRRKGLDYLEPDYQLILEPGDKLLVIDEVNDSDQKITQPPQKQMKILIVDDNPVILRLYTRLMRRAGFIPIKATNGREALELIKQEKPDVVVLDFMLPILSGIEVCQEVRSTIGNEEIILILFTSDAQPETRKRALEAGANAVVVKGSEASELIETIGYLLYQSQQKKFTFRHSQLSNTQPKSIKQKSASTTNTVSLPRLDKESPHQAESHHTMNSTTPETEKYSSFNPTSFMELCDGDRDFAEELIALFQDNSRMLLEEIKSAILERDSQKLQSTAHTLKGAVANFGASAAQSSAREMELLAKSQNWKAIEHQFDILSKELQKLNAELKAFTEQRISELEG